MMPTLFSIYCQWQLTLWKSFVISLDLNQGPGVAINDKEIIWALWSLSFSLLYEEATDNMKFVISASQ